MTGPVGLDGSGGIQPQQEINDEAVADPSVQARVNALSDADLSERTENSQDGVAEGGGIPRGTAHMSGEHRVLHAATGDGAMHGTDATAAIGGCTLSAAVQAASGQGAESRGQLLVNPGDGLSIGVTGPNGEIRGGITESGRPMVMREGAAITLQGVNDGEVSLSVLPAAGEEAQDVSMQVEDTSELEEIEEDLAKFKKEDLEKYPEDEGQTWVQMLEIVNSIIGRLQAWIEQHMGSGQLGI